MLAGTADRVLGFELGVELGGFAWRPSSPRKDEFALLAEFFRDELATPLPQRPSRKRVGPTE